MATRSKWSIRDLGVEFLGLCCFRNDTWDLKYVMKGSVICESACLFLAVRDGLWGQGDSVCFKQVLSVGLLVPDSVTFPYPRHDLTMLPLELEVVQNTSFTQL